MIVERLKKIRGGAPGVAVLLTLCAIAPAVHATEDGGYSYARTVEGVATIVASDTQREELAQNQPLLAGDQVTVNPRSRLEVALSDHNLVRIDGDSQLVFQAIAGSPDREDPVTVLELQHGNLQFVVERDALGHELPRIETGNATIYLSEAGTYRITSDGDWTEVTVRRGEAELVAGRNRQFLTEGDSAVVEGWRDAAPQVRVAGREDSLEHWGRELDLEADAGGYQGDLDPSLRYRAASLSRYGRWDRIEGREVWIPHVAADWRPYHQGRWVSTPLGLTWVSNESWGWVPYHYGTWDYLPGYGWAWYPGRTFGPSWVYWYWTNDYAAWIPTGYYVRYYGRHGWDGGFRSGVYGWAGGSWDYYNDWNFCQTRYLGRRDQYQNTRRGDRVDPRDRYAVPRGILTTDTRDITRDRLRRPDEILDTLAARRRRGDGDMPDVTPFVARRGELPKEVRGEILVDREARRRGTERALPDDDTDRGPVVTTTAVPGPERERRARGRVLDSRVPDAPASARDTAGPSVDQTSRDRTPVRRPRTTDEGTQDSDRRLPRADPTPNSPTPAQSEGNGEEIRSRRRQPTESSPPAAAEDRPPVRRVIDGARRNHPPTPPPTPTGGSAERDRSQDRERARTIDTAGRARRVETPKTENPPPPSDDKNRTARSRESKPENPPPAKNDPERRRRPPGE